MQKRNLYHKPKLNDDYEYVQSLNPQDIQNVFHVAKHRVLKELWKKRKSKDLS